MNHWMLLFAVLFPMLAAIPLALPQLRETRTRNAYVLTAVLLTSLGVLLLVALPPDTHLALVQLLDGVALTLRADGLSRVYAAIIALLWPATAVYAFDYMGHERHQNRFYAFFLLSYGVAAGVAFSGNLVTMYLFFELLTLATLPLVMHKMDDAARYAGKRYLIYSMTGAALGLIGVVMAVNYGQPLDFTLGGTLDPAKVAGNEQTLRIAYTLAFFGFGVKAALLPMSFWLPAASVAPTPVTALLHAVAVVKAGAFACMRLTYYAFGTALLSGTTAQKVILTATALTIVAGSGLALRNGHLKRRLAWSTVANLSYILFGAALMTDAGLVAANLHMAAHALMKITLFFGVGAIMEKSGKSYIDELEGMAKRMPVTFSCMALAALALTGVPPLPGFFSKWTLGEAAVSLGTPFAYLGMAALLISAVLTALYMATMLIPAFFPSSQLPREQGPNCETKPMNAVLLMLAAALVLLGLCMNGLTRLLSAWLVGGSAL
ncbi:MAG TPA: proton-conducting transporter membrane subunit [Clostridia bacterium]|nr:proton-conducting transporter membrane subunit [Clostridia bacterium]